MVPVEFLPSFFFQLAQPKSHGAPLCRRSPQPRSSVHLRSAARSLPAQLADLPLLARMAVEGQIHIALAESHLSLLTCAVAQLAALSACLAMATAPWSLPVLAPKLGSPPPFIWIPVLLAVDLPHRTEPAVATRLLVELRSSLSYARSSLEVPVHGSPRCSL
jgi:hypothetical protein